MKSAESERSQPAGTGIASGLRMVALVFALLLTGAAMAGAGSLGPGDEQLVSGEYYDRLKFDGIAGDEVLIELTSTEFDPYLMIVDSSDTPLGYAEGAAGAGAGARIAFTLPEGGTYSIIVTSWLPGETGGYSLMFSAPAQAAAVPGPAVPAKTGGASSGGPQPGSVTGTVVDTQGNPIAGAQVTLRPAVTTGQADYRTGPDGTYLAASLPDVPYYARAWTFVDYGGQRICMRLGMESESDYDSFSPGHGAVRNFRMQLTGPIGDMQDAFDGHFGGAIYFAEIAVAADRGEAVEFTFTPTGPLLDGTVIEPFTRALEGGNEQLIRGIPIGPYRLSAETIGSDGSRRPLGLALTIFDDRTPTVELDWTGDSSCSMASGFDWVDVYSEYSQ